MFQTMGVLSKKKKKTTQLLLSMQINTLRCYWLFICISIIAGMSNCLKKLALSCFFKHLKACISVLGNDKVRQIGHRQNTAE